MQYVRINMCVPKGLRKRRMDSRVGGAAILVLMSLALASEAPAQIRVVATDAVRQSAVFSMDGNLHVVTVGSGVGRSAFRLMHITESGVLISTASSDNGLPHGFVLHVGDSLPSDVHGSEPQQEPVQTLFYNEDRPSPPGDLE